jgi:uncharacterized protein YegP (UPF0339 family)
MNDEIVDYVEVITDENGQYRVRGRSNNGEIIWTSEQYEKIEWARKVALDSGKEVREGNLEKDVDGSTTPSVQSPDTAE